VVLVVLVLLTPAYYHHPTLLGAFNILYSLLYNLTTPELSSLEY